MKYLRAILLFATLVCGSLIALPYAEPHLRGPTKPTRQLIQLSDLREEPKNKQASNPSKLFLSALNAFSEKKSVATNREILILTLQETELKEKVQSDTMGQFQWVGPLNTTTEKLQNALFKQSKQTIIATRYKALGVALSGQEFENFEAFNTAAVATKHVKPFEFQSVISQCETNFQITPGCVGILAMMGSMPLPAIDEKIGKGRLVYNRPLVIWRDEKATVEVVISADPKKEPDLTFTNEISKTTEEVKTSHVMSISLESSHHLDVYPTGPIKKPVGGEVNTRFKWTVSGLEKTKDAKLLLSMFLHLNDSGPSPIKPNYSDTVVVRVHWGSNVINILKEYQTLIVGIFAASITLFVAILKYGPNWSPKLPREPTQTLRPGGAVTSRKLTHPK